ncbi:MAG: InlB B-repeat-containing protein [Acutalibacteraceae bacterium]|nr:InlB B-repeat-containing protein [Acutalibacteraceae bacterium]
MQKTKTNAVLTKALSCFCAVLMLFGALYVPVAFNISAANPLQVVADEETFFDMSDTFGSSSITGVNKEELDASGVGFAGWGAQLGTANDDASNKVILAYREKMETWATAGALRLNKKVGDEYRTYNLEPSTTYIVSLQVRCLSSSVFTDADKTAFECYVSLGYGAKKSTQENNFCNAMDTKLYKIVSTKAESGVYTIQTQDGNETYACSPEWQNVIYTFTTPADFKGQDTALAIYSNSRTFFRAEIDNISVTKLGANTGVVILNDHYSGKTEIIKGEIGSTYTLPDISDRATQADHGFEGWFADKDRTQAIDSVAFAKNTAKVYSKWDAPVSITFVNTLTGAEEDVSGKAGESFEYPADPVDANGEQYFMGWYTTQSYTEEHTSGKFGYTSAKLYSLWMSSIPQLYQDFENYTKDEYTVKTESSGNKTKSNHPYFAIPMSKQSEVTASENSGYAIKFDWDAEMTANNDDINAYNAAERYYEYDNYIYLGKGVQNSTQYTIKFKYKIEKVGSKLDFYVLSAKDHNAWDNYVRYNSGYKTYTVSDEWQEFSYTFTTNFKVADAATLFLGVRMENNADTVIYIDDVSVTTVQPYEAGVTVVTGIDGVSDIVLVGKRGEKFELPTLTHPLGAEFEGWYTDKDFLEELNTDTYARKPLTVYAKWGSAPITFENYPYNTSEVLCFGTRLSIANENGVGTDDNYALRWNFVGDSIYEVKDDGEIVYENTRATQKDHVATVGSVSEGTLYRVTLDYKSAADSKSPYFIRLVTAKSHNIWDSWTAQTAKLKVNGGEQGWNTAEFIFIAKPTNNGNTLYIEFTSGDSSKTAYINALVDNVKVEAITGTFVHISSGTEAVKDVIVEGKAGDTFKLPEIYSSGKVELLGLYYDSAFTKPFIETVMPKGATYLYAKIGTFVQDFSTYEYDTGEFFELTKEDGYGYDDNSALTWELDGPKTYYQGANLVTHASRGNQWDHGVTIHTPVKDGVVYKVTYYYKASKDTNVDVYITPVIAGSNIWWQDVRKKYDALRTTVVKGGSDWTKVEFIIGGEVFKSGTLVGDRLILLLNTKTNDITNYANIRIDNVKVEQIYAPYVYFDGQNGDLGTLVRGKAGDAISAPSVTKVGYDFVGWYTDKEGTVPFTQTVFKEDTAVTVYAKWSKSNIAIYDYERFYLANGGSTSWVLGDAQVLDFAHAKSGNKAVLFDRTQTYNNGSSFVVLADATQLFELDRNNKYLVTVNYYVEEAPSGSINMSIVAGGYGNAWTGINDKCTVGENISITAASVAIYTKKWLSKTFALDLSCLESHTAYDELYLCIKSGANWKIWIDDITVITIPDGMSAVSIDTSGCKEIPASIVGKTGESFANKLPEEPVMEGMHFSGYFTKQADGTFLELKREDMKFQQNPYAIYARFLAYEISENFDDGKYARLTETYKHSYSIYDFDYEIYDSALEGNSAENVTSGRYSLHRKGNTMYFENAVILTLGNQIAASQKYTVSFKVKLGKYRQTDGAVKIVSGKSSTYAWTTTGDYYPIVSIKELLDGQWHEVSYTFNSVEAFACIQTPGYVELFMDDFKFSIADDSVPLSTPISYTEYVPAERDEQGNLIYKDDTAVDITSIIDVSLYLDNDGYMLWVIIGVAGGVILIAAAVVTIILVKKKKRKA